jgi:hypothetical protein
MPCEPPNPLRDSLAPSRTDALNRREGASDVGGGFGELSQILLQFPVFTGLSEPGLTKALLGYFGGGTGWTGSALIFFCR